jgi:hypothetical protein
MEKITPKKCSRLLDFMHERQRIYIKRQRGDRFPWTDDEVLRAYRLENIYREQDRETIWLRENWREPYKDHPNLWFACCLFRSFNWSPTLAEVGFPLKWEPERVVRIAEARRTRGVKFYTSAFMAHSPLQGEPGFKEKSKARYTVYATLDPLWKAAQDGNRPPWETCRGVTLEAAQQWLSQFVGWGDGFLTYEAVSNWRHTRYLRDAPDTQNWAHVGPGAEHGIERLVGVDGDWKTTISEPEQLRIMRSVFRWINRHRDRSILPTLEMRDIEHSLCAWFKFERAHERLAAGRPTGLERFQPPRRRLI